MYPEAQLLFTDTDSLYYDIATLNLEKELYAHKELFDYSDYPEKSEYFNETNKKVIGKFKCESRGNPIEEFVGLRPKMYSYVFDDKCGDKPKRVEKHRAKGIAKAAARALTHAQYKAQLDLPQENFVTNRRLGSQLHKIYAIKVCPTTIISCSYSMSVINSQVITHNSYSSRILSTHSFTLF